MRRRRKEEVVWEEHKEAEEEGEEKKQEEEELLHRSPLGRRPLADPERSSSSLVTQMVLPHHVCSHADTVASACGQAAPSAASGGGG